MKVEWMEHLNLNYETIIVDGNQDIKCSIIDEKLKDILNFEKESLEECELPYRAVIYRLPRSEWPNKVIKIFYKNDNYDINIYRESISTAIQLAKNEGAHSALIYVNDAVDKEKCEKLGLNAAEASILSQYQFDKYLTLKKKNYFKEIGIYIDKILDKASFKVNWDEKILLAQMLCMARDLVNEPANQLTPTALALKARHLAEVYGFEVEVLDTDQILDLKMDAYYSVAKGSEEPPKFIIMKYFNDVLNPQEIVGLVGKGITYDSGGLNIKSPTGMKNMRADMGGAAAVLGAISSLAKMKAKVNVVAVIPACENLISGRGYKIGDTISSMAGKTIFIESTDAEGRLTLIDGVTYLIQNEAATKIVDIATLTGAAGITLGHAATPVLSNNDTFFQNLNQAAEKSFEKIWRMPTFEDYRPLLKSKIADLTNLPDHPGMITAGMFVGEFVEEKPWLHIDIAATSWADKKTALETEGATGVGVKLLYYLLNKNIY